MIDTIAKRAFNLNGTDYAKGDTVTMPLQQFNDLEPTELVERPPAGKPAQQRPLRTKRTPEPTTSTPAADAETDPPTGDETA